MFLNGLANALCQDRSTQPIRMREHYCELLTAITRQQVLLTHLFSYQARSLGQNLIPYLMSIRVVDPLEVVDIHQAARKRRVIALRFRQACGHLFIKVTTVIHAGEFVDYRLRAQLVVSLLGSQR